MWDRVVPISEISWVGASSHVQWEDVNQALCTEPDTWKPLNAVHFPHCRSDRKVSVLLRERSNTTANNQMLNDEAALSLAVPPLAKANVTDKMAPKSRSCSLRQLHVHIIFAWVRVFLPWYFDFWSQITGCPVHYWMFSRSLASTR